MEFFSRELREPDERLLETMRELGSQVGQFVARRHAEEAVHASESRLRAMLEAALDAVVTMDHRGRVVGWNHAAETTFGYRADEVVGREMAELIVPPSLRAAHRAGLARFLETEQPVVLDRRVELTGMHKNGAEFPVELTITRIALPGPPTFTGYLRDITERKQAEAELRASRARLVEVADAERRRIQRNLHDGAQQRLTAVLLSLGRLRESQGERRRRCSTGAIDELAAGLQEIRELASGLHPSVLSERGLARGARGGARSGRPSRSSSRCCSDEPVAGAGRGRGVLRRRRGLANVHKHADATRVSVSVAAEDATLVVEVGDDGSRRRGPGRQRAARAERPRRGARRAARRHEHGARGNAAVCTPPARVASSLPMVTLEEVRAVACELPRSAEAFVRGRVKFRVGRIVYLAFSRDETLMGFAFPKEWRDALVETEPAKFMLPRASDLRYNWVVVRLAAIDADEMRELVVDAWAMVVPRSVPLRTPSRPPSAGPARARRGGRARRAGHGRSPGRRRRHRACGRARAGGRRRSPPRDRRRRPRPRGSPRLGRRARRSFPGPPKRRSFCQPPASRSFPPRPSSRS